MLQMRLAHSCPCVQGDERASRPRDSSSSYCTSMMLFVSRFRRAAGALLVVALLAAAPAGSALAQSGTSGSTSLDAALAEVDSLREAGAFRDAFGQLNTLRNEHPDHAGVLYRLAFTRVDIGEQADSDRQRETLYSEALDDAEAALQADTSSANAHLAMAIAQGRVALSAGTKEKIGRSRAVKQHADRAIEINPDLAAAYHVRARWNREVADLGFFSRAIVKTVYGGLPEASFEQAVEDFKTAIQKEDKIVHHLELARTYMKMDRESDARSELQKVLAMDASDPDDPMHKRDARKLLDEIG